MTTEPEAKPEPVAIPLKIGELSLTDWPCPEDLLERKDEIENLSPVLLNAAAPLVFALDAPWGGGKTTFIKLWQHYLESKCGYTSLYLNAWESDFAEDPLLPVLATFDKWLKGNETTSEVKKSWEKVKTLAPSILKASAIAVTKIVTFGAVDADKITEQILAEATGKTAGNLVESFSQQQSAIKPFKKLVGKAMAALPKGQQNLIIFVDELDRCRPTYAVEMLERIKHLFEIERLVFVLSINRDQLSKSIQGLYGSSFDGDQYLKRFIDLDYQLRTPETGQYLKARLQQEDIEGYFNSRHQGNGEFDSLKDVLAVLIERFGYTLRDINQLVLRLRLILRSIPINKKLDPVVLSLMLILRKQNSDLYQQYIDDPSVTNEVIKFLMGDPENISNLPDHYGWIGGWMIQAASDHHGSFDKQTLIKSWQDQLGAIDDSDPRHYEISRLIKLAKDRTVDRWHNQRKLAFQRIELVEKIDVNQ
ncbi:MAG: NTPase KAP [Candidatus Marinimicrobia bacterium]|jgi:hypothetical protein|nr:NTPase KAP [Candidatus Neomarinimicrobiota bacterium]MBT6651375.1 NTPase KAP [Gammaproteobacteria bacterium]